VVRRPQGFGRGWKVLPALAAGICALALAPAGAAAADPAKGCTQTDAPDNPATQETEWTCYSDPTSVAGYEVKRGLVDIPKPAGVEGNITHMEVDVADGNGAVPISRLMLHHIVFFNTGASDSACGGPERFYGAGEERLKMSFPEGYGYQIGNSDNWYAVYMYMNHRAQTDKGWVKYSFTVDPDPVIRSTRSYWLDVGNCAADPIYNVPGIDQPKVPNCAKLRKAAKKKDTKGARRKAKNCEKKSKSIRAAMPTSADHVLSKDVKFKHDGWIVTGAGHVHGGAKELNLTKPSCPGSPEVAESIPTWGNPDHPFYNVKPILHEPGPVGMSAFRAPDATLGDPNDQPGIPIANNQTVRLNSVYDDLQPHTRVMGIYVVYVLPRQGGDPPIDQCAGPAPGTVVGPGTDVPGRPGPVPFRVPLTGLDSNLNAIEIDGPPGDFKTLSSGATITVGDRFFSEPNVKVKPGTTLNYAFTGNEQHNLTLANGPLGIGSPDANGGYVYSQKFDRPGTYRFFCGLHPVQMSERVVVENPKKKKKKKRKKR
jgi:plastocyanin